MKDKAKAPKAPKAPKVKDAPIDPAERPEAVKDNPAPIED